MLKKTMIISLVLVLLIGLFVVPASAANIEPAFHVVDMREGAVFSLYNDGNFVGSYFSSDSQVRGTELSWQWDYYANLYLDQVVIIIQGDKPSKLYFEQPGMSIKILCEYEGTVDGYHTYSCDYHSIGELVGVTAEYSSEGLYDYNLVSCYGFYDVSEDISDMYGGGRFYNTMDEGWGDYFWRGSTSLPLYVGNEGVPSDSKLEAVFELRPHQRETEYAKSISYLVRVCGKNPEFGAYLSTSRTVNPVAVFDGMSVQAIGAGVYETDYDVNSNLRYQWYLVTFDLTGYDLVGKYINFKCSVDADQGYSLVSLFSCSISSMIKSEPNFWGRLFDWFGKLGDKISGVGDDVGEQMQGVIDKESEVIEGAGGGAAGEMMDVLPNESAGFMDGVQSLVSSMSYNGTAAVLPIPAIDFPDLPGTMEGFRLLDPTSLDLGWWVQQLPENVLGLVQILCTIALIVFCFKELYATISYAMTLKGGGSGE